MILVHARTEIPLHRLVRNDGKSHRVDRSHGVKTLEVFPSRVLGVDGRATPPTMVFGAGCGDFHIGSRGLNGVVPDFCKARFFEVS